MSMTPDAKKALASTIQSLRASLLVELRDATESAYQLSIARPQDASLTEAARARRGRLTAWIAEQVRVAVETAVTDKRKASWSDEKVAEERVRQEARLLGEGLADRIRADVEKAAAYTLLNRLILLRLLEAGRIKTAQVVTGGWQSGGYLAFREMNPALVQGDDSEGYGFLLRMVFEDLATELPGLFGSTSVSELVPVPTPTLRHVVEALDDAALVTCWTDDMTLGWVYQYWNDPEREALDAKLNAGGKVERHEIASKTQMFTERYMVDWLLQNSVGPMWLATCARHGWTADAVAQGTLDALEARRVDWRARRDAGEVSLTALMPVAAGLEARWAYYVPQPLPDDAVAKAPESFWDLRVLDPAVGSGHFLVVAFELLFALHQEEARQRGLAQDPSRSDRAIVERILEHNLSGIDLDPRAVQIAAAALWLKARQTCADAHPKRLNLVASNLRLAGLPDDDPALVELRREVERETGIPGTLTDTIVHALRGADHLGSLLKVDVVVDQALAAHEDKLGRALRSQDQGDLFGGFAEPKRVKVSVDTAKATLLGRLESFLAEHTSGDDLGLRLRGEQLAAGVRFLRLVREGTYDLVVGNPPYQGTAKMADAAYVQATYPRGKADLYAAFLERGLQLVREGGTSAMLTMRNWMFIKQFVALRMWLLETQDLRALGDFAVGAFDAVPNDVLSVVVSVFRRASPAADASVAQQPTALDDRSYDRERTGRKRAAVLTGVRQAQFRLDNIQIVPDTPLLYWWEKRTLDLYAEFPTMLVTSPAKKGIDTGDNAHLTRKPWELPRNSTDWFAYVMGSKGIAWIEPLQNKVFWRLKGLLVNVRAEVSSGTTLRNTDTFGVTGIAFSPIGSDFSARAHRHPSICDNKGSSLYPKDIAHTLCALNSNIAKFILQSLNPSMSFQNGDVNRLPLFPIANADDIFARIESAFTVHESHREPSVEFRAPGPSPWEHAQAWAQLAVDRPEGAPLPEYVEVLTPEPATDHVSYALGLALGRFGAQGQGILDPATADLSHALPSGLLFLDGTLDATERTDGLGHPATDALHAAWDTYGHTIAPGVSLREYLRTDFFGGVHRQMYDNRPIHWPLSSKRKTFVAWATIHRWTAGTLRDLAADHLRPALVRLTNDVATLRETRDGADKNASRNAEKRLAKVKPALDELTEFIAAVEACAEAGPHPTDAACKPRQVDARYVPDLDDGVMINSAALYPLLAPQWKDPAKWWKELSSPTDKKHYDWAHLAMRYWPDRVDARCKEDPSLGVAHGCFWAYHPKRAWAWELRLQDEIGPDFRIVEGPYRGDGGDAGHRAAYLRECVIEALATVEAEVLRRRRKKKTPQAELVLLEDGLWSRHPAACWALEMSLIDKQGAEFRLRAPDEAGARAELIARRPELVAERAARLEAAQVKFSFGGVDKDAGDADVEDADDGADASDQD